MRKRLSEEVTREEMLRLREQGYSNTEIAEQLECCYPTVIKYIGKSGIRRANRKDENPAEIKKPEAVNIERLKLVCKTFSGASASFELSRGGRNRRLRRRTHKHESREIPRVCQGCSRRVADCEG